MNYVLNDNKISNIVSVKFCSEQNDYVKSTRAKESCTRFLQAVSTFNNNEFLGWDISLGHSGVISSRTYSSSDISVSEEDFKWIFESNAEVGVNSLYADLNSFHSEQTVYAITKNYCKSNDSMHESLSGIPTYQDDLGGLERFCDLFTILRKCENSTIRIIVESNGKGSVKGGSILLSIPDKITLRIKTALLLAFPNSIIEEVDNNHCKKENMLSVCEIKNAMVRLQQCMMQDIKSNELIIEDDNEFSDSVNEALSFNDESSPIVKSYNNYPIEDLKLSIRAYNCLKRAGIHTTNDLRAISDERLMKVRNLGKQCFDEVKSKLDAMSMRSQVIPLTSSNYKAMLEELIGIKEVKNQINKITAYAKMKQDMEASGAPDLPIVLNMEFVGNPGTAKTTVARILAGVFYEIGILSSPEMVEVGRADLVAKYIGQTADKVKKTFEVARGKLLFIDEAYSLVEQWENSYGDEAIDTIVQEMENLRDEVIVIFAGYPAEMDAFFTRNPGLRSRVPFKITFNDYTEDEMMQITELEAKKRGFTIHKEAQKKITNICKSAKDNPESGNGRFCRNLVESGILNYASRVYGDASNETTRDFVLTESDFTESLLLEKKGVTLPIGFYIQ